MPSVMAAKKGKTAAVGGGTAKAGAKPERISNRLNRVLIAESKPMIRKRQKMIILAVVLVVASAVGGYYLFFAPEAEAPATQENADPFHGQEPQWSPMFEYKTKDQR